MELENEIMELITNSGYARSLVFQAIRCAREDGDFEQAGQLMQQAQEALSSAHEVQTRLIGEDEGSGKIPVHLIMVHAQDHLMNAIMLVELGREIIALHQKTHR
ncbi:PTS lactose/cellobiose transporter subunit IIA [Izhakiella australiensis]|uniref:PTS lactose/cellobiose transporter subunit IIA n=1 Tax=Izhakiella australiensis TaxID=1926881 RepID=A0A1S8YK44_9GAMM|nr:PTS lactose/cellobiose transporter subunit IIA [Izhakiella australiensis]OON39410.1 PTS lactose/cellobiose transporter subunit IIA [Izhakiella australiensis]